MANAARLAKNSTSSDPTTRRAIRSTVILGL
jgi:hypothetical protein